MTDPDVTPSRYEHVRHIALSSPRGRIVVLHVSYNPDDDTIISLVYPVIAVQSKTIDVFHHPDPMNRRPNYPATEGLLQMGWTWSYSMTRTQFLFLKTEMEICSNISDEEDLIFEENSIHQAVICSWLEDEDEERLVAQRDRMANYLRRESAIRKSGRTPNGESNE